ncbi:MAG TPA: HprK-related kinase A, partial [Sphingobium sp.]|nr:HprK-related kinase A [Sphingobium sp.]
FALLDLASGELLPFPRLASLKNGAIDVIAAEVSADRMGPLLGSTAKGNIRHLIPRADAVARMEEAARPALLLFPRFGHDVDVRPVGQGEVFMRLTQASTNYVALGEAGFAALTRFVQHVPARAIDFPSGEEAIAMVERLWEELA